MTDPTRLLTEFRPDVRPPRLAPTDVSYVVEDTAVGRMLLARNGSGIARRDGTSVALHGG